VKAPEGLSYTPEIEELVAIGAAIGSNCESCLEYHVNNARQLGIPEEALAGAIRTALKVKETPARATRELANELLGAAAAPHAATSLPVVQAGCEPSSGCC
jgi:4-carboxymuconolactone decarboxylase